MKDATGTHTCCGCSCTECDNGHNRYPHHTQECRDRFWKMVEENAASLPSDIS